MKNIKKITKFIKPFGAIPNARQYQQLGIKKAFFHFGVNTFSDMEWGNGTEDESSFDPSECDVRQWMRVIKAAGFELAIITAKHHDGFCLWPSKYTEHSIKNSPYKNGKGDLVREFTEAAREYGIKPGVYISPWDRHSPYWGQDEYSNVYALQLKELMTAYGELHEVWWDGAGSTETRYDWGRWASIIREYQPKATIFGSLGATPYVDFRWVGNESGYAGETHYSSIDESSLNVETRDELIHGKQGGERFIPSECDVSIRPGWFYHASQDDHVHSVEKLNKIWFDSIGRNSTMLLNFPPDRRGLICDTDAQNAIMSHRIISRMLATNYAVGAKITADSVLFPFTPEKATLGGDELFYAAEADKNTAVIDIELKAPERINVVILGENILLGERISSFKIESFENETAKQLAYGTSVGFNRAVLIPEGEYSHIRVTLNALAAPTLSRLGLHYYPASDFKEQAKDGGYNLADAVASKTEFAPDNKSVIVNFGGIFPFDTVSFKSNGACECALYAFDGTSWQYVTEFKANGKDSKLKLDTPITESYQIKLTCPAGFSFIPQLDVRLDV